MSLPAGRFDEQGGRPGRRQAGPVRGATRTPRFPEGCVISTGGSAPAGPARRTRTGRKTPPRPGYRDGAAARRGFRRRRSWSARALGWGFDRLFGTSPWGLVVFLLLGFAAGLLSVMRSAGLLPSGPGSTTIRPRAGSIDEGTTVATDPIHQFQIQKLIPDRGRWRRFLLHQFRPVHGADGGRRVGFPDPVDSRPRAGSRPLAVGGGDDLRIRRPDACENRPAATGCGSSRSSSACSCSSWSPICGACSPISSP